jgi:hypothetical protein
MTEIYALVGGIMQLSQFIEHNVALMIRMNEVLKEFDKRKSIPIIEYEKIEEGAVELQEKLLNSTMGTILSKAQQVALFRKGDVAVLKKVLEHRNMIAHHFFKDNAFEQHGQQVGFISKRKKYLKTFSPKCQESILHYAM